MSLSTRFEPVRMLLAGISILCATQVIVCTAPRAEEKKGCKLCFDLPEGKLLKYKTFSQIDQSYGGMDVSMNQTSDVDMATAAKADSGACTVNLKYLKVETSLVMNNQLQEWNPPLKLEGAEIRVTVSRRGKILHFEPGKTIASFKNSDELRELVEQWFIELPDTTTAVGQTWTQEVVQGVREEGEPAIKGAVVYVLKKIEKKGDVEVAFIEGKINLRINQDTPAGLLVAEGKGEVKAQIAGGGGYIVELKETLDIRGNTVNKDPLTDKETKRETAVTRNFECKLQR